tara:strand:- start:132 stop:350 length:219 start_codon:yes stop_codon:yes gene_type:complete
MNLTLNPSQVSTNDTSAGGVRCECDHLTDFIVVKAPSTWDEFLESALAGFEVSIFSWDQATTCLANPKWSEP